MANPSRPLHPLILILALAAMEPPAPVLVDGEGKRLAPRTS